MDVLMFITNGYYKGTQYDLGNKYTCKMCYICITYIRDAIIISAGLQISFATFLDFKSPCLENGDNDSSCGKG